MKRNVLLTTFSFKYDKALYVNSGKISLLKYLFDISIYRFTNVTTDTFVITANWKRAVRVCVCAVIQSLHIQYSRNGLVRVEGEIYYWYEKRLLRKWS